jgi:hypothetical protein
MSWNRDDGGDRAPPAWKEASMALLVLNTTALGGLVVSVLVTEPTGYSSGFKPDRGWWIFMGDKNP